MRSSTRNFVLVITTACFVVMITGVPLLLHLLAHDHEHAHDFANCSICRQFLGGFAKFTHEPETELPAANHSEDFKPFSSVFYTDSSHHESFIPRAPPRA